MQPTTETKLVEQITYPQLPLAVYREIAAHLRQIEGVYAVLISYAPEEEQQQQFDYAQSQIKGLAIEYSATLEQQSKERKDEILNYYAQRYCPWQQI